MDPKNKLYNFGLLIIFGLILRCIVWHFSRFFSTVGGFGKIVFKSLQLFWKGNKRGLKLFALQCTVKKFNFSGAVISPYISDERE